VPHPFSFFEKGAGLVAAILTGPVPIRSRIPARPCSGEFISPSETLFPLLALRLEGHLEQPSPSKQTIYK
jgi:hypothetical protein